MYRVGAVSYLNTKPLIYGLENQPDIQLRLAVPSRLLDGLARSEYDVALLPVIDYQRLPGLRMLCSGGIGSDGETLTVRIFSHVPMGRIRSMACDLDSHTSVALARVILARRFDARPAFVDRIAGANDADAVLLIGDKVIAEAPAGFQHQIDLGEQWKALTGLPFLFAAWMARQTTQLGDLPERLEQSKRAGLAHIDDIVRDHAPAHGWPVALARDYLTRHLGFDIGEPQIQAVKLFHRLAGELGLLDGPVRELVVE